MKLVKDIIVDEEVAETAVDPLPWPTDFGAELEKRQTLEKARETQLVVAALVATVTFAAAVTVPGGFNGDKKGLDQGTPFLIHNAAFQAFIVTDAMAFGLSVHVLHIHYGMLLNFQSHSRDKIPFSITSASPFLSYAIDAMIIAFCTATYVVLKPSHGLAIISCCLGLSSFFCYFLKGFFDKAFESLSKNQV